MEDLDELLSDLENVNNYSNVNFRAKISNANNFLGDYVSSPSSSTSSSVSFNSAVSNNNKSNDFIQSINRIIPGDMYDKVKTLKKPPHLDRLTIHSELTIRETKRESLNSSDSSFDDLNELDKLLDDLDSARKKLAMGNPLDKEVTINKNNVDEISNHYSEELSTSSSLMPSPSLSSPNSNKSQTNTNSYNQNLVNINSSGHYIDKNIGQNSQISDKRGFSNKSTINASQELEKLMNSLSMYKEQNENNFENETNSRTDNLKLKNLCRACEMPINGQVITALGHIWHPEHFVCSHCTCSIGTSIFYEKDNQPYCELDYIQLFSPKCTACNTPILDKMLTALNKSWHINCFSCDSCSKLLNDESFLEINNTAYCKDCYANELAPKCKRCSEAIVENFISALNSYFHPSCFVCTECGMPFNATSFYEYNNMPYCELHYHLKRGSLCANCQQPINGRCVTAMNKKYHPEHFVCSFCLSYLNKGTFKEQNDKPYCHQCFQHLF